MRFSFSAAAPLAPLAALATTLAGCNSNPAPVAGDLPPGTVCTAGSGACPDAGDAGDAAVPCSELDDPICACAGPIADAGFASLATLPIASLCAQSGTATVGHPSLVEAQCGSWTLVVQSIDPTCGQFWIFDPTTGALIATGGECTSSVIACQRSSPTFVLPVECRPGSYPTGASLCVGLDAGAIDDAASEAGATDGSSD